MGNTTSGGSGGGGGAADGGGGGGDGSMQTGTNNPVRFSLEKWLEGNYGGTDPAAVTEITGVPEDVKGK